MLINSRYIYGTDSTVSRKFRHNVTIIYFNMFMCVLLNGTTNWHTKQYLTSQHCLYLYFKITLHMPHWYKYCDMHPPPIEAPCTKEISYTFPRNQWKSTEITRNQAKSLEINREICRNQPRNRKKLTRNPMHNIDTPLGLPTFNWLCHSTSN